MFHCNTENIEKQQRIGYEKEEFYSNLWHHLLNYHPCFHSYLCIFTQGPCKAVQAKLTHKPLLCIILPPITNICSLGGKS